MYSNTCGFCIKSCQEAHCEFGANTVITKDNFKTNKKYTASSTDSVFYIEELRSPVIDTDEDTFVAVVRYIDRPKTSPVKMRLRNIRVATDEDIRRYEESVKNEHCINEHVIAFVRKDNSVSVMTMYDVGQVVLSKEEIEQLYNISQAGYQEIKE